MSKNVTPQFEATIKLIDGKHRAVPNDAETLQQYLDLRFKDGQNIYIVIKKRFKKRTQGGEDDTNQNGYYWGVVIEILGNYFGYLPWEMHEVLRPIFWSEPHPEHPELRRPLSSAEFNTVAWEQKMEEIRIWAASEHDIHIPQPHEVDITGDSKKQPW